MNRKEFLHLSGSLGMGLPFLSSMLMTSCGREEGIFPKIETDFSGKVLIIGAGAAGLSAAYLLNSLGIDFEIIEASSTFGGRLKKTDALADFPIDLGAEWIHTHPSILSEIIHDEQIDEQIDIVVYNPKTIQTWKNNQLKSHNYIRHLYTEWKFKNSTWFDFFERYIVPTISSNIVYQAPVKSIDYNNDKVMVTTLSGEIHEGDKVLITIPIKQLQNQSITFNPPLPLAKQEGINKVFMGDGIKIFTVFSKRFYPDFLAFGNILQALNDEEKFVYDAAFGKSTDQNVLGLFAINEKAARYTGLGDDNAIISHYLAELDEIFDGQASKYYIRHAIQNWTNEPFIQGAYSYSFEGNQNEIVQEIVKPIDDKIYFAGEALSIENQATVHGACESAYRVVESMLAIA